MSRPRPIHKRVKQRVDRSGLTHEQLTKRTRWSSKRLQRVLHGKTKLLARDMETLARVIGCPVSELYGESAEDRAR